jgi:hypothetical protein
VKSNHFNPILLSMILMLYIACEHADVQKPAAINPPIDLRAEDCEDCPDNDCCCSIELTDGNGVDLVFCGTTGPFVSSTECGFDIMGCNIIDGFYEYHTISMVDPKFIFCVPTGTGFSVGTLSGTSGFRITCEEGELDPQSEDFNLSGPQRVYFNVDGECQVSPCP